MSGRRNPIGSDPGDASPVDDVATDAPAPGDVSAPPAGATDPQVTVNEPLTEDPDEESAPEPAPAGFVRMAHDGIGSIADVPEDAVDIHRGRGWRLADDTVPEED